MAQPHARLRRATGRVVFDVSSISEDPEEPSRFAEEIAPTGDWDARGKNCVSSSHDRHVCAQVELHEACADHDELHPLMGDRWDTGFTGWNLDEVGAKSNTRIIEQRDLSSTDSGAVPTGKYVVSAWLVVEESVDRELELFRERHDGIE